SPTMTLLDRVKRGARIDGLGMNGVGGPIFLSSGENTFFDMAYQHSSPVAFTHNFKYVDQTVSPYTRAQLAADPAKGIVYTPGPDDFPTANNALVATTGRIILDTGHFHPNVWFADINGDFTVNGDGQSVGNSDMLTVLGHSSTGLGSTFDAPYSEPMTTNG